MVNMFSITASQLGNILNMLTTLKDSCPVEGALRPEWPTRALSAGMHFLEQHKLLTVLCLSYLFAFSVELSSRREHRHLWGVMKRCSPGIQAATDCMTGPLKGFLNEQPGDRTRIAIELCVMVCPSGCSPACSDLSAENALWMALPF